MAVALALVLPTLVVAALAVRRPIGVVADSNPARGSAGRVVGERQGRYADGSPLSVRLHRDDATAVPALSVSVPSVALFGRPEVLAYWTSAGDGGSVEQGTLLGAVHGDVPLGLPAGVSETPGFLVLYDLAHGEVVATVSLVSSTGRVPGDAP